MQRWLIAAAVTCTAATGCARGNTAQIARRPQQAGTTNPFVTVGHLASAGSAGLTGDLRAMRIDRVSSRWNHWAIRWRGG